MLIVQHAQLSIEALLGDVSIGSCGGISNVVQVLLELRVLFEGGSYMRKYNIQSDILSL